jgi:mutator protein MutT
VAAGGVGEPTRVGIGLIGRGGSYLIRRRPPLPGSPMPGYWEFPGGKCHEGESPEHCARRECREEVGLDVRVVRPRRVVRHVYPHGFVELHFFECEPEPIAAEPAEGSGFRWVPVPELPNYTFPGANETVVADLLKEWRDGSG